MAKYRLPVVVIVYNNNAWGTWTQAAREPRALPIHLFQENLRYDKVAEALGGHGEYVTQAGGVPAGARARLPGGGRAKAGRRSSTARGRRNSGIATKFPPGIARQDRARRDVVLPLMRRTSGRAADGVALALQRYADRGVFRGLSIAAGRGGRQNISFTWLTRRPMALTFEPKSGALVFKDLLPGVGANRALVSDLKAIVDDHGGRAVPAHRRIDARRLRAACSVRGGNMTLSLQVRGKHHAIRGAARAESRLTSCSCCCRPAIPSI